MEQKLIYFVTCENVIVDKLERISLINIFQNIFPSSFPFVAGFHICFAFTKSKPQHLVRITVAKPDTPEKEMSSETVEIGGYINTYIQTVQMQLTEYSTYTIYGYLDGERIAETRLFVKPVSELG